MWFWNWKGNIMRDLKVGDKVTIKGHVEWSFGIKNGRYDNYCFEQECKTLTVRAIGLNILREKGGLPCDICVSDGKGNAWFLLSQCLTLDAKIEINIKINGEISKLSDISEETLLNIRNK